MVHVATVVTPNDVLETNIKARKGGNSAGRYAFVINPKCWRAGREKGEKYLNLKES